MMQLQSFPPDIDGAHVYNTTKSPRRREINRASNQMWSVCLMLSHSIKSSSHVGNMLAIPARLKYLFDDHINSTLQA